MSVVYKGVVERLRNSIRDVPDFPKPGIVFKDITPILNNGQLFRSAITMFAERYQRKNIDKIAAIDARGFVFGAALAYNLGVGLALIRKKGKLPYKSHQIDYELEYGKNTVEIHIGDIESGQRVLIIDDLLATGGTASAAAQLVQKSGGEIIEFAFLVELAFLKGRRKLVPHPIFSAISYE